MQAIELLHNRVSCPVLVEPGPTDTQLDSIFQAAMRAPDHGAIRPWRFLTVSGEARNNLGELFLKASLQDNPDLPEDRQDKVRNMPMRSPTLIVVIASTQEHPKVPVLEQEVAAGCAAQNILHAAHAMGLGAMWRTGDMAYHSVVRQGLGLAANETLIGYIYLGTPKKLKKVPQHNMEDYVQTWTGEKRDG
jgi:nitroreductase